MARTASTFKNHTVFPAQGEVITSDGITHTFSKVIASDIARLADGKADEENSRSGEMEVPVYTADSLEAGLFLFGGSEANLLKAAVDSFNLNAAEQAKRFIATEIQGPDKVLNSALVRLAKQFGTTFEVLRAKVDADPSYKEMLLALSKA